MVQAMVHSERKLICLTNKRPLQIYLHYMPIRNGIETKQDLRLKDGVRWFTYWKGRLVVMADVTAM